MRTVVRPGDSVRGHVVMLLLSMVLLVTVVAGAGAIGVTSLSGDVDALVDDLRPAAYGNIALRNDLTGAQAAARGWAMTGEPQFLARYRAAVGEADDELQRVRRLTRIDPRLGATVERQAAAIAAWTSYAGALVRGDFADVSGEDLLEGQRLFDLFVEQNDALSAQLNAGITARGEEARERAHWVIALVALLSVLGLALTALLGRGVIAKVSGPMQEMEAGVARLASGDLTTRVGTDGPREMRGVAAALNTLAEENQRSRELEAQVVAQLRELDRVKDEFVSTVSHELRTPLTSIAGYIELVEDGLDGLTPEQTEMLQVVQRNVDRLRTLIEDLLTLSQVESDAFRTSFEPLDLSGLTADVARDVAEIAARAHVRVRESTPGRPVMVKGDAGQLSRALLNLVTNAVKFSPPDRQVLLRLSEFDGKAVVSVVDHGIGIPAEELATLGTRFFRASNAVEAEITGTGLGLRIVHSIAENHGGRLELESVEGQGTTARLLLPLADGSEAGAVSHDSRSSR